MAKQLFAPIFVNVCHGYREIFEKSAAAYEIVDNRKVYWMGMLGDILSNYTRITFGTTAHIHVSDSIDKRYKAGMTNDHISFPVGYEAPQGYAMDAIMFLANRLKVGITDKIKKIGYLHDGRPEAFSEARDIQSYFKYEDNMWITPMTDASQFEEQDVYFIIGKPDEKGIQGNPPRIYFEKGPDIEAISRQIRFDILRPSYVPKDLPIDIMTYHQYKNVIGYYEGYTSDEAILKFKKVDGVYSAYLDKKNVLHALTSSYEHVAVEAVNEATLAKLPMLKPFAVLKL